MATRNRDIRHDYRPYVGEYIKGLRILRGLSQRQLADAVGMMTVALDAVEKGRNIVLPEKYDQMADALGVSRGEFAEVMLLYTNSRQAGAGAAT